MILHLISLTSSKDARQYFIPTKVWELADGGMGSIQFTEAETYGSDLVQVQYHDNDGILVLITLVESKDGNLFELDFWKTDFSPLCIYPTPDKIQQVVS